MYTIIIVIRQYGAVYYNTGVEEIVEITLQQSEGQDKRVDEFVYNRPASPRWVSGTGQWWRRRRIGLRYTGKGWRWRWRWWWWWFR